MSTLLLQLCSFSSDPADVSNELVICASYVGLLHGCRYNIYIYIYDLLGLSFVRIKSFRHRNVFTVDITLSCLSGIAYGDFATIRTSDKIHLNMSDRRALLQECVR